MAIVTFKESPLSPWGLSSACRPRSRAGGGMVSLPDAVPRAQKTSSEVVGCISYVNSYLSETGLHRRNTLPPVIFDLYSPPQGQGSTRYSVDEQGDDEMAHRRGKVVRKKRLSRTERPDLVSKQTQEALEELDDSADTSADTQLVELATFPGFNPHTPTPLPHGIKVLDQMKRVTGAQTRLTNKHEGYRVTWRKIFYSPPSQDIFMDYFWWFFLHKYQTNQLLIQDMIFSRIADSYVKLICEPMDIKMKDSFFKMYPDVIAQCVYSTLLFAYPNSWNSFDDAFKSELCLYISLWQVGTKPMPTAWTKWQLHLLEPLNLPKRTNNSEEKVSYKGVSCKKTAGKFDLDALLVAAKDKEANENRNASSDLGSSVERISFSEVKKVLSGLEDPLACHPKEAEGHRSEGVAFSASQEKRIEIAKKQLSILETAARPLRRPSRSQGSNSPQPPEKEDPEALPTLVGVPPPVREQKQQSQIATSKPRTSLSFTPRRRMTARFSKSSVSSRQESKKTDSSRQKSVAEAEKQPQVTVSAQTKQPDSARPGTPPPKRPSSPWPRQPSAVKRPGLPKLKRFSSPQPWKSPGASHPPKQSGSKRPSSSQPKRLSSPQPKRPSSPQPPKHRSSIGGPSTAQPRRPSTAQPKRPSTAQPKRPSTAQPKRRPSTARHSSPGQSSPRAKRQSSARPKRQSSAREQRPSSAREQRPSSARLKRPSSARPKPAAQPISTQPKRTSFQEASHRRRSTAASAKGDGVWKKMALSLKERSSDRSQSVALKGPEFEHVLFNLYGHSPLVKHYMENKNLTHISEKEVVVGRTEIAEEPARDAACYQDVLDKSKKAVDNNRDTFRKYYKQQRRSIVSADKKRLAASYTHEQNVKIMLGNKREVQQLSNELALHALQPKMEYNKAAVSSVIRQSLQRATLTPGVNLPQTRHL